MPPPALTEKPALPTRSAALGIVVAVALVTIVVSFERRRAGSASIPGATPHGQSVAAEGPTSLALGSGPDVSAPQGDGGSRTIVPLAARRAARDEVRERIWRALDQPAPAGSHRAREAPSPLTDPPGPQGHATEADEEALGEMHGRWKAFARECYDQAAARTPGLRGKVAFHSVIVGDPSVGGIVESAELAEGGTIDDPELVACLREWLLTLPFPPPRGGSWYRFDFPANFGGDAGLEQE